MLCLYQQFITCNLFYRFGNPVFCVQYRQKQTVCLAGGKWKLNGEDLEPSSQGLHNIAEEKEIRISCQTGDLLIFVAR